MKLALLEYANYHQQANADIAEALIQFEMAASSVSDAESIEEVKRIVLAMWDEGAIWWQRLKLQEVIVRPSNDFSGSMREALGAVQLQDTLWQSWISHAQPMALEHVFQYYDSKRHGYKLPVYKMLLHLFNHASQCGGALLQILRQADRAALPSLEWIPKVNGKRLVRT